MTQSNLQNTTATNINNKRKRENKKGKNTTSGPALKSTRLEAKSSKSSRIKEKEESEHSAKKDAFTKQEERLAPIISLLASLPKPFDAELKAYFNQFCCNAYNELYYIVKNRIIYPHSPFVFF